MASKYLSLDEKMCTKVKEIVKFEENSVAAIVGEAINILDGTNNSDATSTLATACGCLDEEMDVYLKSVGSLIWEFVKASSTIMTISHILQQVGFSAQLAECISKCMRDNTWRLLNLKKNMAVSSKSYADMEWRLDVEIARRHAYVGVTEPKFLIRLDLFPPHCALGAAVAQDAKPQDFSLSSSSTVESIHLEADYGNLKNMQRELQCALDELNGTHCQRFARYIS